ncbi:MAG: hypothetical protein AAFO82_14750 [Bacteroidota bacterium]
MTTCRPPAYALADRLKILDGTMAMFYPIPSGSEAYTSSCIDWSQNNLVSIYDIHY